jgi:hypothetical protein
VEAVLGAGVAVAGGAMALSTKLVWYPDPGWNAFELVRHGALEGLAVKPFFAVTPYAGGEDVVDLWVGPGVTLILAAFLVVLGAASVLRTRWRGGRSPTVAHVACAVSVASLGLALWSLNSFNPYNSRRGTGLILWLAASATATVLSAGLVVLDARRRPVRSTGESLAAGLGGASTLLALVAVLLAGTWLVSLSSTGYQQLGVVPYTLALLLFVVPLGLAVTMAIVALACPGLGARSRAWAGVTLLVAAIGFGFLPHLGAFGGTGFLTISLPAPG